MTFSLVALDPTTGAFGAAAATSDIAVGARVPWTREGVGAVVTQHTTDPRLGWRALDRLAAGASAEEALVETVRTASAPDARQLACVDRSGRAAVFSGRFVDPAESFEFAGDGFAVVGNMLADADVGPAIVDGWSSHPELDLSTRLVTALTAGLAAGGETSPLRSCAVRVHWEQTFPYVDLRVDDDDDPLGRLAALDVLYAPKRDAFVRRALDPDVSYVTHLPTSTEGPKNA